MQRDDLELLIYIHQCLTDNNLKEREREHMAGRVEQALRKHGVIQDPDLPESEGFKMSDINPFKRRNL